MLVYLDGEYVPRDQATISVDDRGFLFGDGVYEVTRARAGRLVDHERHVARLARGLHELQLAPARLGTEDVREISERLLADNGIGGEATVYLQVTRGAAPRTHHFPLGVHPTVYVSASAFAAPDASRDTGVAVVTYPDQRWGRCDLKTINLLPNVMAKQHAVERGAYEGVFIRDGVVTEGASTSIFGVSGGILRTHPLGPELLPGVTRAIVLELARSLGIEAHEDAMTLTELLAADELFLTSTTNDVMPIVCVDGASAGGGAPGPVTRRLSDAFAAR